ncbi:MAG: NAD(P)/FAD-dependent oxidoreductase [Gammaproteobacteria bacterium]|nr:NAD(P)/FAD-dependent oxidoreductase [Gammaproteobacteria bacterium]MDH5239238.1 NAD(P)/FAD-dependent oxidoreductase [Gammaproteobacteria bacterium]MDH5259897.1 NAD(P)/FAD-dependent oxidoreductase [Gammaproteobacteria bacterium]
MDQALDCVVIGAGVIGLAAARALAMGGRQVIVLEAEAAVATHTSSRNSEVIHAGIYYPQGSLKASACVAGKRALYAYCEEKGIPHRRIGKLVVATEDSELGILDSYVARARANGVTDLVPVTAAEVREMEPAVRAVGGVLSPSTGIIDSHAYVQALQADTEANGGTVVCRSRVSSVEAHGDGFRVHLDEDGYTVDCRIVVNAAGLWATDVAARIAGFPIESIPRLHLAKGHYFTLQGKSPFNRLVYPVAGGGGLGTHVTLDLAGQAKFGPDVEWLNSVDYSFDQSRKPAFVDAIRRYYPDLDASRLVPGYTGIRPKLSGPGEPAADFTIQGAGTHGIPGLVNLFGIESPGLTASLEIARRVAEELLGPASA